MKGEVGTKCIHFCANKLCKKSLIFYLLGYNYNERECE